MDAALQPLGVEDGAVVRLPTPIEIVKDVASGMGYTINDGEAEYVLWEETGWPAFWRKGDGATLEDCLRKQAGEFFEAHKRRSSCT